MMNKSRQCVFIKNIKGLKLQFFDSIKIVWCDEEFAQF